MPELPEVETVRRGLDRLIVGRTVENVSADTPKSFPNAAEEVNRYLLAATVTGVRRRAKVLLIDLSTDYTLVVHLKMTGQLVYRGTEHFAAGHPSDSLVGELPDKSTRVILLFTDGSVLYFNDQRKFGWVKLYPSVEVPNIGFMKKVGPEPLERTFTAALLHEHLQRRKNTSIKAALLDQTVLAGIGNIYADEALWGARLHPARLVKTLSTADIKALHREIRYMLNLSIERGGSTDKNYVNAEGQKGSYLSFARVFRRQGQPCPRCSSDIVKIRVAGRGTHICTECQMIDR